MAIVGSGVAGLVAARELHAAGAEITLLEAEPRLGGHAHTVTVEARDGAWDVDTGFIVLNDPNYPNFERLLDELRVAPPPPPHRARSRRTRHCWTSCASPPSPPR